MKLLTWPLLLIASFLYSSSSSAESCSISEVNGNTVLRQYEFSWEVQGIGHQSGTFANGDCWILGPVTVVDIQPASTNSSGRIRNGSQLNPSSRFNGYDSSARAPFQPELNVSPNLTGENLEVASGSILSTLSKSQAASTPQLEAAAVLTVLEATPPPDAFRPPYFGSDKSILGVVADLDYSILRKLPAPNGQPNLCNLESKFERAWIEQHTWWEGRFLHPSRNQPDYGREMASVLGEALLSLNLNYRDEDKELLFIRLVQYGIDVYGAARGGQGWPDQGGHNHGRKLPLILAGLALDDAHILSFADAQQFFKFQEDRQTWYVTQEDVGRPLFTGDGRLRERYIQADVGIAEWGETHTSNPSRDGRNWNAYYRDIVSSSIIGHVLAAEIMGIEGRWNHPPLFDYIERYYGIEKNNIGGGPNDLNPFEASMYEAYGAGRATLYGDGDPSQTIPRPCGTVPDDSTEACVFDMPE